MELTNDQKLMFYSLYKQAIMGKNTSPKPNFLNFVEKSKWEAWTKLSDMSSDEAKLKYVEAVKEMIEAMSKTLNVTEWLKNIDTELAQKLELINYD
ncbi:unnamed protein product [Thelazia callipaeda]|uniref:ACB domain-containing protein n=1 Tax=Thelazia callipaeda TaxID=103827 RepID=A0A0N5D1S7_THECL|nr:unnamed protein product [Thelazia callipaeda]